MKKGELYIIAHNIRSAHNVGAIFRTADGAGVARIYLTGYTPEPAAQGKTEEEKTKAEKMLGKTALGAETSVPWERMNNLDELLLSLKKQGVRVVALEKTASSISMHTLALHFPMALILGNEVEGVNEDVLARCDAVMDIPMRGTKESLNVSVAAGIAMYKILG
ncbi:MAG: TrmH family RNA methyltransferase [Parcubacteria group bacterium]|jgi:tRNA G18 (ribose-2'-O)-methylase SpoU